MTLPELNLTELDEETLNELRQSVLMEIERRQTLSRGPNQVSTIVSYYLAARDAPTTEPGVPPAYVTPTSYMDAYPKGYVVTHAGKEWTASRDGATGEPGVVTADWTENVPEDEIGEWVQPQAGQSTLSASR